MQWYKQYVRFQAKVCGKMRHPAEMGTEEVTAFLTNLAVNRKLAAASQNQALNALVFLYREVLKIELEGIDAVRAKRPKYLPVVLTQEEVKTLLAGVKGAAGLAVKLLYGCGLRVAEVLALRIKDVDTGGGKIDVRGGKGDKNRVVTLPKSLLHPISNLRVEQWEQTTGSRHLCFSYFFARISPQAWSASTAQAVAVLDRTLFGRLLRVE